MTDAIPTLPYKPITLDIAQAAQRSSAAYFTHPDQSKAVFEHLGYHWLGIFQNGSSQAVLSIGKDDHEVYLSISGTRASALKLEDIFLDVDLQLYDLEPEILNYKGGPLYVTRGVHADLDSVWRWAINLLNSFNVGSQPIHKINVDGHSLGGARVQLTPFFIQSYSSYAVAGRIYSFEAPKFAEADYFAWAMPLMPELTCVLNGADGWAAWPWDDKVTIRPPVPHLWLRDDATFAWIEPHVWPGGMDFKDHDIDLVVKRLQHFVASP